MTLSTFILTNCFFHNNLPEIRYERGIGMQREKVVKFIKNAIIQENATFLSKTPGIGKKTAERIIVDLKNAVTPNTYVELDHELDKKLQDVVIALTNLGYQKGEVHKVLKNLPLEAKTTEEMVTYFLQNV